MEGPINYNIDVKNPFEEYAKGLQLGNGIRQMQNQQAQEAQMAADMAALQKDPSPQAILSTSIKYPQMTKQLSDSFKMSSDVEQKAQIKMATSAYSAVASGRLDIAANKLIEQGDALKNSGREKEADAYYKQAEELKTDPNTAKAKMGLMLAAATGADNFGKTFLNLGKAEENVALAPYKLAEQQADTSSAMTEAAYADSKAQLTNANMQNQMAKRDYDKEIAKLTYDLKANDSQLRGKIGDEKMAELRLKQQQLKDNLARATQDRDYEGQTALANNEDLTNGIKELLAIDPEVMRQAHGSVDDIMPTFREQTSNYKALVDVVKSKVFLKEIQSLVGKGAGSLSDAEGAKLESGLRSLSMKQSAEQMRKGLEEILPLLTKARGLLQTKYAKTPTQGAAPSQEGDIEFIRGPDGRPMRKPSGAK